MEEQRYKNALEKARVRFLLDKMKAFGLELDTVDKGIVSIKKPIAFFNKQV